MRRPPNIVFLLADDLGYADVGCNGQTRFETPNIDRIAREGMNVGVHYSGCAVCAPSRAVLMTGQHPGHTPIRDNIQAKALGLPFDEGQAPLPAGTTTLPSLLRRAGYATGAFGKWGLGPVGSTGDPARMGIERFYGYNCQAVAHNHYPTHLWDDDRRVAIGNPAFAAHQKLAPGDDPADPAVYARFVGTRYAPDLIHEEARHFIRAHRDRPFFCFVPTTVPHLALQVPPDSLARFADRYPEAPYSGGRSYLPARTPRAVYAAMVWRLDQEVGRLLDLVAELGLDRDTLFVFTSDNGPLYDRLGGTDADFFRSAGDFRGRKGSLYEGGIRVPCLVRWQGTIRPGTRTDRVTGFEDWLPTLLDLAGRRADIPRTGDGVSFAPTLLGRRQAPRPILYREHAGYGGQQFLSAGRWKLLREGVNLPAADRRPVGDFELYDLDQDPRETTDVARRHPERVAAMAARMRREHVPSPLFPMRALDTEGAR